MMMDDSAPTHERRKLVNKNYRNVLLENRLWFLKYAGRPTPKKNVIKWSRKAVTDVIHPAN